MPNDQRSSIGDGHKTRAMTVDRADVPLYADGGRERMRPRFGHVANTEGRGVSAICLFTRTRYIVDNHEMHR